MGGWFNRSDKPTEQHNLPLTKHWTEQSPSDRARGKIKGTRHDAKAKLTDEQTLDLLHSDNPNKKDKK